MTTTTDESQPLVRACAACEKELGILNRADIRKSHGICRRHLIVDFHKGGIPQADIDEVLADMDTRPESYCPDLLSNFAFGVW